MRAYRSLYGWGRKPSFRETMAAAPVPTHDSAPSLDDEGVLEFCKRGFLLLPGAVGRDVCELTHGWLEQKGGSGGLDAQPWFAEGVLRNPALAGVLRSLLGPNYALPQGARCGSAFTTTPSHAPLPLTPVFSPCAQPPLGPLPRAGRRLAP